MNPAPHAPRKEYGLGRLRRSDLDADPIQQFAVWFQQGSPTVMEPNAMALATADPSGRPSIRMVLLKGYDHRGFAFATNYHSRKGSEIGANPQGSILFYWPALERQVRAVGSFETLPAHESDAIFMARPRLSRIAAISSRQSSPIDSRNDLEAAADATARDLQGREVTRPEFWGGYRLVPAEIEFWQGRQNRLHDRFQYLLQAGAWTIRRLQP